MKVILNGSIYHLKAGSGVQRTPMVEWPDNTRLDGQQQRKDRRWLSSWAIDRWSNGLGIQRMNVNVLTDQYRLWDVENCDTRYPSQIVLSPAFNTCTIAPSAGDLDLAFPYLDELYFVGDVGGTHAMAYKFTAPDTLGSFNEVCDPSVGEISNIVAIRAFGGNIAFVGRNLTGTSDAGLRKIAALGESISEDNVALFPIYSETVRPQFGDFGGTLHLLTYSANKAHFLISNQEFTGVPTLARVASIATVVGSYLAPLESDGVTMYAQLPEGIYNFDITPNVIIDTKRSQDKNCQQVMFQNLLHFKNYKSLVKYDENADSALTSVGYDKEDGLPSDKWGEITAMTSSFETIFAAVKGATYSHILTCKDDYKWQYYARIPTAGLWIRELLLNSAPDGQNRLWCLFSNYNYPGYFLHPLTNPLLLPSGSYPFVGSGHFTLPIFDGGMSEEDGAFYDISLSVDNEEFPGNRIYAYYGLDGAVPTEYLGKTGTNSFYLPFPTASEPYGVEAKRIQPRFDLINTGLGYLGNTPVFRQAVMHYLKIPEEREMFDFDIDLRETAKSEVRPLEAIIGSLNYERGKKILMPFWYGRIGTKNVKVLDMPGLEEVTEDRIFEGEREGIISVKVAEII